MIKNYSEYMSEVHEKIKDIRRDAQRQITEVQEQALEYTKSTFSFLGWNQFWSKSHLTADGQFERLEQSVTDTKLKVIRLDKQFKNGILDDLSGSYEVSGSNCSCADFVFRGLPCKHIYFLANALINANNKRNNDSWTENSEISSMIN